MKKITMIIMFLCLSLSFAFAQNFEYTAFVKTVIEPEGYAEINKGVYRPGEIIYGSDYKLVKIEYDYVVLEHIEDKTQIRIGFKFGNKASNT